MAGIWTTGPTGEFQPVPHVFGISYDPFEKARNKADDKKIVRTNLLRTAPNGRSTALFLPMKMFDYLLIWLD